MYKAHFYKMLESFDYSFDAAVNRTKNKIVLVTTFTDFFNFNFFLNHNFTAKIVFVDQQVC